MYFSEALEILELSQSLSKTKAFFPEAFDITFQLSISTTKSLLFVLRSIQVRQPNGVLSILFYLNNIKARD